VERTHYSSVVTSDLSVGLCAGQRATASTFGDWIIEYEDPQGRSGDMVLHSGNTLFLMVLGTCGSRYSVFPVLFITDGVHVEDNGKSLSKEHCYLPAELSSLLHFGYQVDRNLELPHHDYDSMAAGKKTFQIYGETLRDLNSFPDRIKMESLQITMRRKTNGSDESYGATRTQGY